MRVAALTAGFCSLAAVTGVSPSGPDPANRGPVPLVSPAGSFAVLDNPFPRDTPPATPAQPNRAPSKQLSKAEYEGWRQYSVQCARCHGQDVLPNPVAANLLVSLAPGGPVSTPEQFLQIVSEGRADKGMPGFKRIMTPDQIQTVYAYVKGRAEKRIAPGRPSPPSG